jgi:hypothetical protein
VTDPTEHAAAPHSPPPAAAIAEDYRRLREWLSDPERKPASLAFTAGPLRDAATAAEDSGVLPAAAAKPLADEELRELERELHLRSVDGTEFDIIRWVARYALRLIAAARALSPLRERVGEANAEAAGLRKLAGDIDAAVNAVADGAGVVRISGGKRCYLVNADAFAELLFVAASLRSAAGETKGEQGG